jgi:GH18 family chitinase
MFRTAILALTYLLSVLFQNVLHAQEYRVVAYVPNWINLHEYAAKIKYDKLTHICIAFENPDASGQLSFNKANQPLLDAAHKNNVKVLISIGGGSASNDEALKARYFDLISASKRKQFATDIVMYLQQHKFDGIDVDLEGESINEDYGGFITELASQCRAEKLLTTAALSSGFGAQRVPDSVYQELDFLNIMAYDAAGPWRPQDAGQHSSIEFAMKSVEYFTSKGLAPSKAVLGIPFYGYGFGNDFTKSGITYRKIIERFPGASQLDQVGSTIWYNGQPTVRAKAQYVKQSNLGGIMIWALHQDTDDSTSLLTSIDEVLKAK